MPAVAHHFFTYHLSLATALKILLQIHPAIQARDLIVAVEHQCGTLEEIAEPAFFGLAPARMVHVWVYVGVKTILSRRGEIPRILRLLVGEADTNDRLRALETVFPGQNHADGRAVLVGKILAIHAEAKQREWMHGFVHAQTFDVGPLKNRTLLARHLSQIHERGELDVLRFTGWVHALDQFAQRKTNPWHHDRPAFDASMTIDALLGRSHLDDLVHIEFLLLVDQAVDLHLPRTRAEVLRQFGGLFLFGRELVVVVVVGHVFVGRDGLGGAERTLLDAVNLVSRENCGSRVNCFAKSNARGSSSSGNCSAGQKFAPVKVQALGSDLRRANVLRLLDEHQQPQYVYADPRSMDSGNYYLQSNRTLRL